MDGNGLPARCLRASRPRNTRPKTPSLHFALRSLFYLFRLRRRGARAGSARAPGDGSYFFALGCFKLNRPSSQFCVSESVELNAPCRPTRAREAASVPHPVARRLRPSRR